MVEMHPQDLLHLLLIRELDVVEDAPAQKRVRQLLFRVGGDDDDGPLLGPHRLLGLRNVELHLIQLPQKVVGELQVCLVDLVDEQHHPLLRAERLAQLDIVADIIHAMGAELAVVEPLDHIVDIQAILSLGGGLDVPDDELFTQGIRHRLGQHGLARTRLALDEQRLFQRHRDIHRQHQLL